MDDETLFDLWFESRNLAKNTRETYRRYALQYAKYTQKSLPELREEAVQEKRENVPDEERQYNFYAVRFIKHLRGEDKSRNTVNAAINAVTCFYNFLRVTPPELTRNRGDITLEKNFGRLIEKEEIHRLVDVASPRDRAIIYTMALSGFSQQEVRKLTLRKFLEAVNRELDTDYETIKEVLDHEKVVKELLLQLDITREKVHYRYTTFMPPETVARVLTYLRERYYKHEDHMQDLDDTLYVKVTGEPLARTTVTSIFNNLGARAGFKHPPGTFRWWRSHSLRRYFITTVIDEPGEYIIAQYLSGHRISDQDRTYWRSKPEQLRKKYLKALPYLSLDEGRVLTFESEEYRKAITKITKLEENQERNMTNLKPLADVIEKNPEILDQIIDTMTTKK